MSLDMNGNQVILLASVVGLTLVTIFVPDNTLRAVAVGALAGVVGGHLNGSQSARSNGAQKVGV